VDVLKQTDPLIATLGTSVKNPNAAGNTNNAPERTGPAVEAAARFENLAALYARDFTEDELNSLIAFYRSPFVQKMGSVQPRLEVDIANLGAEWFEPFRVELEARLAEAVREIAKE
jgi:hypothetical protein